MANLTGKFFKKIYESSAIAVGIAGLDGYMLEVNDAWLELTGYSRDELFTKRYQELTPPEFHVIDEQVVNLILNNDRAVEYEKEIIHKDGTQIPILLNSVCIRNESGEPIALAGTAQRISQYKSYQNELKDFENKLASQLDITNEVVCELDKDCRFLSVSSNSKCHITYEPSDIIDGCFMEYIHSEDLFIVKSIFEHSLRHYSTAQFSFRFKTKKGDWMLRDCTIKPYRISSGETKIILNFKDVSDNSELKSKLFEQHKELRKLDSSLEQRVKDMEILCRVVKTVHQSLNLKEVYEIALDIISTFENIDMTFLYLLDSRSEEAVLIAQRNVPQIYISKAYRIPKGIGITWKIINNGQHLNVENIQNRKDVGAAGKQLGHHGVLGVPIKSEKTVIGVIYFASYKYHKFDQHEVKLLTSITDHLSIAISKAKLYDDLKESEKKYRELYENVPTGIYRKSENGKILMANSTLISLLGFSSFEEMISKSPTHNDFIDNQIPYNGKKILLNKDAKISELDSIWQKNDGSVINVIESIRAVNDKDGNFLYYEGTVIDISQSKKLKESRESLRKLTEHLVFYREEERTEVAREIHDDFAQMLTGMTIDVSWLKKSFNKLTQGYELPEDKQHADIVNKLDDFTVLINNAFETVKRICARLRPEVLDKLGLEAAIKWQIVNIKSQTNIDIDFYSSINEHVLDSKVKTTLFRIFQEAITNIIRHAEATEVKVTLQSYCNDLVLIVNDNGKGMKEDIITSMDSLGLLGMTERTDILNGELTIKSNINEGTSVTVIIPYTENQIESTYCG
ncbi:MAG: PAS domain S-box protein [Thermodesulfobacteriota bacterium]